jgi:hypothetical protein
MRLLILVPLSLLLLSSCSYFAKKSCEKVNWYQHGFDLSQSGKRISNSDKVNECKRLEVPVNEGELDRGFKAGVAENCSKETSYNNGKAGKALQYLGFCGGDEPALRSVYLKGYAVFCENQVPIAYDLGMKGETAPVLQDCSEQAQNKISASFNKGFRQFCISKEKEAYAAGKEAESFAKYEKCDADVVAKLSAAYDRGVSEYCNPKVAYQLGLKGDVYKNVCPETKLKEFISSYNKGRFVFLRGEIGRAKQEATAAQSKVDNLELQVSKKRLEIEKNQLNLASAQQSQSEFDMNSMSLQSDLRRLERKLEIVKAQKARAEQTLTKHQEEALNIGTGELGSN